jgi:hypothetical protein
MLVSICPSVRLPVCLSVRPPVLPFICPSVHLTSICLSVYLYACFLSVHLSFSVCLSIRPSVRLSLLLYTLPIYLFMYSSDRPSMCLPVSVSFVSHLSAHPPLVISVIVSCLSVCQERFFEIAYRRLAAWRVSSSPCKAAIVVREGEDFAPVHPCA